jgi:hypothetical protein
MEKIHQRRKSGIKTKRRSKKNIAGMHRSSHKEHSNRTKVGSRELFGRV